MNDLLQEEIILYNKAHKDPIIQERVFQELGTYQRLQEFHTFLESANNRIGVWQPLIDGLQNLTGESVPMRILLQVKRWKESVNK